MPDSRVVRQMKVLMDLGMGREAALAQVQVEVLDGIQQEIVDSLAFTVNHLAEEVHQLRVDLKKSPLVRIVDPRTGEIIVPPGPRVFPEKKV